MIGTTRQCPIIIALSSWFAMLRRISIASVIVIVVLTTTPSAAASEQRPTSNGASAGTAGDGGVVARGARNSGAGGRRRRNHDTCEGDHHCLNGGYCSLPDADDPYFRHCHCPEGFGGDRCENYCPLQCQHGGYCRVEITSTSNNDNLLDHQHEQQHPHSHYNQEELMQRERLRYYTQTHQHTDHGYYDFTSASGGGTDPSNFACKCLGRFTGKLCEVPYENCRDGTRCHHGGKCIDVQEELASLQLDQKNDDATQQQSALVLPADWTKTALCQCPPGYEGDSCESVVTAAQAQHGEEGGDYDWPAKGGRRSPASKVPMVRVVFGLLVGIIVFVAGAIVYYLGRKVHHYHRVPTRVAAVAPADPPRPPLSRARTRSSSLSEIGLDGPQWKNVV